MKNNLVKLLIVTLLIIVIIIVIIAKNNMKKDTAQKTSTEEIESQQVVSIIELAPDKLQQEEEKSIKIEDDFLTPSEEEVISETNPIDTALKNGKPTVLDLGAGKCIPCKMMAPILEELKKEYAGRLNVEFIDVWQNPGAGKEFDIKIIPTQIFYNSKGKEIFRHEGFFSKEDILNKWKELDIKF